MLHNLINEFGWHIQKYICNEDDDDSEDGKLIFFVKLNVYYVCYLNWAKQHMNI